MTICNGNDKNDPWYIACLSLLFPGAGHLYIGCYILAICFFILTSLMNLVVILVLLCPQCFLGSILIAWFVRFVALPAFICWHAYRCARKRTTIKVDVTNRTCNLWLSVFLSIIFPGIGHAYQKRYFWGGFFFLATLSIYLFAERSIFFTILLALLFISTCIHAFFSLPLCPEKKRGAFIVFVSILIPIMFWNKAIKLHLTYKYVVSLGRVSSASMEPMILVGEIVVVNQLAYNSKSPSVGDIVIMPVKMLSSPTSNDVQQKTLTKRVVAIGGETIHIVDNKILVDGRVRDYARVYTTIRGEYTILSEGPNKFAINEPYLVPKDSCFLLGDAQGKSLDSRAFGAVPQKYITGQVTKIIFPIERSQSLIPSDKK
jgi:signal peptidase I